MMQQSFGPAMSPDRHNENIGDEPSRHRGCKKSGFDPPDIVGFRRSSHGEHFRRGGVDSLKAAIGRSEERP
jgi:hypothetical protein